MHARNIHVTLQLYGHIKMKFFDAEAIIVTLLTLDFLHFSVYIFPQKNNIRIYKVNIIFQYGVTFK